MYPIISNVWVLGVLFFVLEDALSNEENSDIAYLNFLNAFFLWNVLWDALHQIEFFFFFQAYTEPT